MTPAERPMPSYLESILAKAIAGPDRFEQHWFSIGIQPMHRALIHRLAIQEVQKSYGSNHRIYWQTSQDGLDLPATETHIRRIEWIDASLWASPLRAKETDSPGQESYTDELLERRPSNSIRILWCWNTRNWRDFLTATPWMVSGLVYNLASLNSWVQRSLNSGTWNPAISTNLQSIDLSNLSRS